MRRSVMQTYVTIFEYMKFIILGETKCNHRHTWISMELVNFTTHTRGNDHTYE